MAARKIISGIYSITNSVNGKIYIGSSFDIHERWLTHKQNMRRGKCNEKMKDDISIYGVESFIFSIVEECISDDLLIREQFWIDYYDSCNKGYNIKRKAEVIATKGLNGLKCLLYDLDGNFIQECSSYNEAMIVSGGGRKSIDKAIKDKGFARLKNFILKPFMENYPLKIDAYKRKNNQSPEQIKKTIEAMCKASTGRIVSNDTLDKIRIPILKIDKNGNIIEEYKSIGEAKRTCNKFFDKLNNGTLIKGSYRFVRKSDYNKVVV